MLWLVVATRTQTDLSAFVLQNAIQAVDQIFPFMPPLVDAGLYSLVNPVFAAHVKPSEALWLPPPVVLEFELAVRARRRPQTVACVHISALTCLPRFVRRNCGASAFP